MESNPNPLYLKDIILPDLNTISSKFYYYINNNLKIRSNTLSKNYNQKLSFIVRDIHFELYYIAREYYKNDKNQNKKLNIENIIQRCFYEFLDAEGLINDDFATEIQIEDKSI